MAGPLSVTHIIVFSQSEMSTAKQLEHQPGETELISNLNLKIYKVPRGPTLTFKILRYSLMIDILNADKYPRSPGAEFKTEPLVRQLWLLRILFKPVCPNLFHTMRSSLS
jgi:ribosome biogenesis protein SSF1/2